MTDSSRTISKAQVAYLAGVARAAVTQWRQRHDSFPTPVDGAGDRFDLDDIIGWLDGRRIPVQQREPDEAEGATYGDRARRSLGRVSPPVADNVLRSLRDLARDVGGVGSSGEYLYLLHCLAWADLAGTSELARKVLLTCQREQPQQVAAWTNAAVFGAVLNRPNAKAAVQIGSLILAANLLSLLASGELARDMVFATRAAVKAAMPVDNPANIATDPLPIAAEHMRILLLGNTGITPDQVFPRILEFFGELDDRDRQLVTEAILAKDR